MYTAKIINIKKDVIQATLVPFIDVEVAIFNGKKVKVIESRKFGYPLDTASKQIQSDVQKYLELFEHELKEKEKQKAIVELNKKADATIEALKEKME